MPKFVICYSGLAYITRKEIIEAKNREEAEKRSKTIPDFTSFCDVDLNWEIPNECVDVECYLIEEMKDE